MPPIHVNESGRQVVIVESITTSPTVATISGITAGTVSLFEGATGPLSMISESGKVHLITLDMSTYGLRNGLAFMAGLRTAAMTGTNGMLLICPNINSAPHLIIDIQAAGTVAVAGARFTLTEGVTAGQPGTQITAYNRNRNSTIAPNLQIWQFARTYVNGTTILEGMSYAGSGNPGARETFEVILKTNKTYSLELAAGGGNDVLLNLSWLEITR